MFSNWQDEKAKLALIDAAQAMADKLASAKRHILDSHAATAQFWAVSYRAEGLDLYDLAQWKPAALTRFTNATQTKIAALRKQRAYDSSDGLAIWLHTARAVTEPRLAPAVREIWRQVSQAGVNADAMAGDLLAEAGLPPDHSRRIPTGFQDE